ncbi:helix-turn-helix domain-containing protein, partial [Thermodesulfobacteriota bacterium]
KFYWIFLDYFVSVKFILLTFLALYVNLLTFVKEKMSPDLNKIGNRLREYRKSKGYSIVKFSELAGVSHPAMSGLENNKSKPSYDTLFNLIKNTDINIYWLFFDEGEKTINNFSSSTPHPFDDPRINELFESSLRILNSGNSLAINALENCIKIFDQTIQTEKRLDSLEDVISELTGKTKKHKKGLAA